MLMPSQTLSIYSSKTSPRLYYVLGEMIERILGLKISLITDLETFIGIETPKLSYGQFINENSPYIAASGLLFEKGILSTEVKVIDHQGIKALFPVEQDANSCLPYDALSAVFYMLSRYEEYIPFQTDHHGRFSATLSLAYKHDFLNQPVVQLWVAHIAEALLTYYPDLQFKKNNYTFQATFDIDVAYAFKNRSLKWQLLSMGKDIFELKFQQFVMRCLVLIGFVRDPFDTYEELLSLLQTNQISSTFFFQCGKYAGKEDKSLLSSSPFWNKFIASISKVADIGLHPSYSSNYHQAHFENELALYSSIAQAPAKKSRQHFLKLRFPQTYRNLVYYGIEHDYTMGYADACGFRAGTSLPFYFYDLNLETVSNLLVHPFVMMDGTLKDYLNLNQSEALEVFQYYKSTLKEVGGEMMILCHNHTFSDDGAWKGWKETFMNMLKEGKA